jgi:hypothetical protein
MAFPKVVYDPGSGPVTVAFARGPRDFMCGWSARVHDNLATSGLRERIVEARDLVITFSMPAMGVGDDLGGWSALTAWMLDGGQVDFYPDAAKAEHYHVVSDDTEWKPGRVGPGRYSQAYAWRIVPDGNAPSGPDVVMRRFYGIAE